MEILAYAKKYLIGLLLLGLVFYFIERVMGARRRPGYFRPGMLTDSAYFFTIELFKQASRFLLIGPFLVLVIAGVTTGEVVKAGQYQGFGPLAAQPVWLQAIEIYLLVDFIDYWLHRLFHTGAWWPFHAVHHSSEDLDWLSAVRVHPVNEAVNKIVPATPLLLMGFDPTVTMGAAGFLTFYAIFLHADVDWDFGPLRAVIATPVFHRWHHSKDPAAIDKNFAGLLPLWDILFGTYYMPKDRLPQDFGATEPVPAGYFGQLWHPFAGWFRRKGPPPQP
ncbi:MAG: sterol desaturase family protein [Verrucomicrobia bacterium]|nr:sterol desaturase family protein [Verrucomicrobiota bacterium]